MFTRSFRYALRFIFVFNFLLSDNNQFYSSRSNLHSDVLIQNFSLFCDFFRVFSLQVICWPVLREKLVRLRSHCLTSVWFRIVRTGKMFSWIICAHELATHLALKTSHRYVFITRFITSNLLFISKPSNRLTICILIRYFFILQQTKLKWEHSCFSMLLLSIFQVFNYNLKRKQNHVHVNFVHAVSVSYKLKQKIN